jgi:hypothetical protein
VLTIVGKIKECSDTEFLIKKQKNYSFAFHKLYKHFEKTSIEPIDQEFVKNLMNEFNLNLPEYRSLFSDVETKKKQITTINKNKVIKITKLKQQIIKLTKTGKKKPSAKNTRALYRTNKKIKKIRGFP